jgi:hypothetical protein
MKTLNLDKLNIDDFFDSMDRKGLNSFESYYMEFNKFNQRIHHLHRSAGCVERPRL